MVITTDGDVMHLMLLLLVIRMVIMVIMVSYGHNTLPGGIIMLMMATILAITVMDIW
jgi:hypothetical protein